MPALPVCLTINLIALCFENNCFQWKWTKKQTQLQTVDHLVRWSMKNAASCVKRCEMQDTPSTWFSNAYCSLGSFPGLRLSEGRFDIKIIVQVCDSIMSRMPYKLRSRQTYADTRPIHKIDVCAVKHVVVQVFGDNSWTLHVHCWPLCSVMTI